jgi:hypothetical protein
MARLPWTKFQDFYLRLGFLKVLVAALSPQRRSALNNQVVRRLESPLFDGAPRHTALWDRVRAKITGYPHKTPTGRIVEHPETAEALLVDAMTESILYGITKDTAYKILDWGRNVDFVGRGNQITERGLLLRHLTSDLTIDRFFDGDVEAWNPFVLTTPERLLFLYHLLEIDSVTVGLIDDLAMLAPGTVLESQNAAELTCRSLFRVLNATQSHLEPRDIPQYRVARELACTIALELGIEEYAAECEAIARRRPPKALKLSSRRSSLLGGGAQRERKTTKNADHQTIPRFEQLVDLGFLTKPPEGDGDEEARRLAGRKRWRYVPTDACRRWVAARRGPSNPPHSRWSDFARPAVAAFSSSPDLTTVLSKEIVAAYLWRAYSQVARLFGHTPFDSLALSGMLSAAADGLAVEMTDFHRLMLSIKKSSALPQHAFFAAGNEIDTMFVQLKPGFVEGVTRIAGELTKWEE